MGSLVACSRLAAPNGLLTCPGAHYTHVSHAIAAFELKEVAAQVDVVRPDVESRGELIRLLALGHACLVVKRAHRPPSLRQCYRGT